VFRGLLLGPLPAGVRLRLASGLLPAHCLGLISVTLHRLTELHIPVFVQDSHIDPVLFNNQCHIYTRVSIKVSQKKSQQHDGFVQAFLSVKIAVYAYTLETRVMRCTEGVR
jgi:hypothetical protein